MAHTVALIARTCSLRKGWRMHWSCARMNRLPEAAVAVRSDDVPERTSLRNRTGQLVMSLCPNRHTASAKNAVP